MSSVQLLVPFVGDLTLLERQLRSMVAQRDPAWTATVVAGSAAADGAGPLVERLGDDRITHVPWDGAAGIGATWNRALGLASATLVVLAHDDDELLPGYVGCVRAAADSAPEATLIVPRAATVDRDGLPAPGLVDRVKDRIAPPARGVTVERGQRALVRLMVGQWIVCPAVAYRRDLLGGRRFSIELEQALDLELFARLVLDGATIASVPDTVYRYRRHTSSQTARTTADGVRFREEAEVHRRVATAAAERGWRAAAAIARARPTGRVHEALVDAQTFRQRRRTRAQTRRNGAE